MRRPRRLLRRKAKKIREEMELEEAQAASGSFAGRGSAGKRRGGCPGGSSSPGRNGRLHAASAASAAGSMSAAVVDAGVAGAPFPASRVARSSADQRPSQRRPGNSGADCQGTDRQEGRAHHQPHRAARTIPGLHADREPYRSFAQDRFRRRAPAPEAHHA